MSGSVFTIKSPSRLNGEDTKQMYSKHLMYTQTAQYSHTSQYFHTPDRGCLHEIENIFFQNISDWTKQISKTLTPNGVYIYIA